MLSYVNWCRFVLQRFPLRIQKAISRLVAARYGRWVTGGCWVLLSKMFVVEHRTHFVGYTKMWPIVAWIVRFQTKDERSEWCKGKRDYACSIVLVPQIVGNVFRARTSRKRNENRYEENMYFLYGRTSINAMSGNLFLLCILVVELLNIIDEKRFIYTYMTWLFVE